MKCEKCGQEIISILHKCNPLVEKNYFSRHKIDWRDQIIDKDNIPQTNRQQVGSEQSGKGSIPVERNNTGDSCLKVKKEKKE